MSTEAKCPLHHTSGSGTSNRDWWPNQLRLEILRQHSELSNPMGDDFNYAKEFKSLDLAAVKKDLRGADDRLAGLVAGRLRPLRPVVHPHGMAQRGHLPHRRRTWRRGQGQPALPARSPVGPTTSAWTRRAGCSGQSSKSMGARSPGAT